MVRRLKGLWRVCLPFVRFSSSSLPAFCPFVLCFSSLHIFWGFAFIVLCLSCCLPCLFLCPCVFFFPYGLYAKERAQRFVPCVLARPVVGCFIWLRLYIPRTRQMSARLYRNRVLEKGNLIECSKLFRACLCSCLCSSKFVFLLFPYLFLLVGSYFLYPFRLCKIWLSVLEKFVIVSLNIFGDTFV